MTRVFMIFLALLLGVGETAQAHVPGLQGGGINASRQLLGLPTPEPPPVVGDLVPGITPFSNTLYGNWAQTSTPALQGSGDTTNAIMAWEMPPFAPITSANPEICVYARNRPTGGQYAGGTKNDIVRVRFYANNGSPVDVTTETVSSRSPGRNMYCTNLNLTGIPNNTVVEIRAVGYPGNGQPVVLQGDYNLPFFQMRFGLPVVANYTPTRYYVGGSGASDANNCTVSNPCSTFNRAMAVVGNVDVSNVEVCFAAGSYSVSSSNLRQANFGFATLTSCPGVDKNDVTLTGLNASPGPNITRFRIKSVKLVTSAGTNASSMQGPTGSAGWLEDIPDWYGGTSCYGTGSDNCYAASSSAFTRGMFFTEVSMRNFNSLAANAVLYRNVVGNTYNSDYGQNIKVIINGSIPANAVSWCCNVHPDLQQISTKYGGYTHVVYGLTSGFNDNAGLFSSSGTPTQIGECRDCAYEDITFDNTKNDTRAGWQWDGTGPHHNVYIRNLNMKTGYITNDAPDSADWTIIDSTCVDETDAPYAIGSNAAFTYYGSPDCD